MASEVSEPEVKAPAESEDTPSSSSGPKHPDSRLVLIPSAVPVALMAVALFLPWISGGPGGQSLSSYGAPQPTVVAWVLLAVGLATAIVSIMVMVLGAGSPWYALTAGGLLYFTGAVIWYGASILPALVASGCNSDGGPLCNTPAGSPVLHSSPASGFILAVIASVATVTVSALTARIVVSRDVPRSP
ncbi:MAG TPA: hypothetical protein VFB34_02955 [Chloroflexota bacterium]|nr:hypothetical protein [Chloroflexota bacterium]